MPGPWPDVVAGTRGTPPLRTGPHSGSPHSGHDLGTCHRCDSSGVTQTCYSQPRVAPAIQLSQAPGGQGECGLQFFNSSWSFAKADSHTSTFPHLHLPYRHTSILPSGPLYCTGPNMGQSRNMCEKLTTSDLCIHCHTL